MSFAGNGNFDSGNCASVGPSVTCLLVFFSNLYSPKRLFSVCSKRCFASWLSAELQWGFLNLEPDRRTEGHFWLFSILLSSGQEYAFEHYKIHENQWSWNCRVSRQKNEHLTVFFYSILSNPLHKMNFLGGARGCIRLIPQSTLLKSVSKK